MELEEAIKECEELTNEYLNCTVIGQNMQVDVSFTEKRCKAISMLLHYIKEESIPRAVVEEKLKEMVKEANFRTADNPRGRVHFVPEPEDYQIIILQELLNKGE